MKDLFKSKGFTAGFIVLALLILLLGAVLVYLLSGRGANLPDIITMNPDERTAVDTVSDTEPVTSESAEETTPSEATEPEDIAEDKQFRALTADENHQYPVLNEMVQENGTLKTIGSKYDYADFFTSISSIYGDNIVINSGSAYFNSEQSIAKFVLTDQDGAPLKPSKLTLSTSGESDFIQVFKPLEANYSTPSPSNNPFSNFIETGPIEVITSGETNEIYVAVTGNGDGNGTGSGIMYCMDPTTLTIEAVVGNDIYSYTRNEFTFNTNNFYVFNVTMTKKAPATGGN